MRKEISVLRNEVETTLRNCLALKQFKKSLSCTECTEKINENVYFWMIFEQSIQTTMFIGLRRLFENESGTFNFQRMINLFKENIGDFSKNSLRQRKVEGSNNAHEWIDAYMSDVHEVTIDDFNGLAKIMKNKSREIKGVTIQIASKIYAHALHCDSETKSHLMKDLRVDEIESALTSIWHVYNQIWEMYENGRKPKAEIGKYPYEKEVVDAISKQIGCVC